MTRRAPLLLLALALLLAGAGPAIAQDRTERQIALLPSEGLMEVTPELRNRLGLFPEVNGFVRARLFEGTPGPAVLEIESRVAGEVRRERRELGAQALAEFRRSLVTALDALETGAITTREGRGGLVLSQTLLGLGYHGWAVPAALDIDSSQGAVATYLLTAGAHFYLPYRLTRNRTVTEAHRNFTWYGGTRGIGTGILLVAGAQGREPEGSTGRARLAGGTLMGTAASLGAFHAVDRWRPDEGTAALWGLMGDQGFATGAALAYVLGPYADEEAVVPDNGGFLYTETRARNAPAGHFMTVAGGGLGLVGGHWLGDRRDYTQGNTSVLRTALLLGAQSGLTLTRLAGADDGRTVVAGALGGSLAGLWGGDRLLRPVALSDGEGLLVNAGHIAGGALALGLTYLVVDDLEDRERLYLSTSTVGSLLGAGLVWRAVARDARVSGIEGWASRVGITVNPTAVLADSRTPLPPLVTIRF